MTGKERLSRAVIALVVFGAVFWAVGAIRPETWTVWRTLIALFASVVVPVALGRARKNEASSG